ncbi:DNA mismatch repair endonuclease MutL [Candidatus Dependentiae bacterium]|nr:DNA mismatch repair endonuclease MutL [Candidatus Dependentiae bacterium]
MSKIKRLPLHEAQKIAAGEVVDRPANVVKELVENALDAGSTQITVYIEQAGKKLIRVVDNGSGMDPEDARICFEQHATSKISSVEELQQIITFGFRGEALSSIAAVSTVTLVTKTEQAEHGIKLFLVHGEMREGAIAACTTGTDISVAHLFDNVPARKKFLKKDETEWRAIIQVMHAFCLDYTSVHFRLVHDGRQIFLCHRTETLEQRIAQLWDAPLAQSMLSFQDSSADRSVSIHGVISHHQNYRYDRSMIYLFVNRRWVKNHQLSQALIKGYHHVLPPGRYPVACLFVDVDTAQVDINIHPRKEEVLFLHPVKVTNLVQSAVKKRLEEQLSAHLKKPIELASVQTQNAMVHQNRWMHPRKTLSFNHITPESSSLNVSSSVSPTVVASETEVINKMRSDGSSRESVHAVSVYSSDAPIINQNIFAQQQAQVESLPQQYSIIGQYNRTYILVDHPEGLFVIDQHAAHERILYEQFGSRFHDADTIQVLFPHIMTFTEYEVDILERYTWLFQQYGIGVSRFGSHQMVLESTPVYAQNISLEEILRQVVGWVEELNHVNEAHLHKALHERLRAQMACKAAVKAGDELTYEHMKKLLQDLDATNNRLTCPHGRPTGWLLSLYDLEKKFKRRM